MGVFKKAVVTEKGQALLTKSIAGLCNMEFTKVSLGDSMLTGDLASMVDIGSVKQSSAIAYAIIKDATTVSFETTFTNQHLTQGYYVRNIGLYAKDPDEGEILYSISVADESVATASWMPAFSGMYVNSLLIELVTAVSNSANVNVMVDPTLYVTVDQLNSKADRIALNEKRELELMSGDVVLSSAQLPVKLGDFANDVGYITRAVADLLNYYSKAESYTKEEVNDLVSAIPKFKIQPVSSLPTEDISEATVYLLSDGEKSGNLYTEYIYVKGAWECLGSQEVDLSGYAKIFDVKQLSEQIDNVTPQMFGAVGDGVHDDTDAIQTALNKGGVIFFPSGRYKVTRQLNATKACTIKMDRPYPSRYHADYPIGGDEINWGARIETYATGGYGLYAVAGVSVDGLYIRAMNGFTGVVFKYDGTFDIDNPSAYTSTYPTTDRLKHIRIDNEVSTTVPESLFDFMPYSAYGMIVEDVIIGSNHTRQFATYGMRIVVPKVTDANGANIGWANGIYVRDVVVDIHAKYPLYLDNQGFQAKAWRFSNLAIQAQQFKSGYVIPNHENAVYIKGFSDAYFAGCKVWDILSSEDLAEKGVTQFTNGVIYTSGLSDITAFGNDSVFDGIDTVLTEALTRANELNLAKLTVTVATDGSTGNHTVYMSDGAITKTFVIPATSLSNEQIANGITQWMEENADPKEIVGTNKLDPAGCFDGSLDGGSETASDYYWSTGYIPVSKGDVVRFYDTQTPPVARTVTRYYLFNSNKNALNGGSSITPSGNTVTIELEDTAYIRIVVGKTGTWGIAFADRSKCMVTVNTTLGSYEPYTVTMSGGIASYIDLEAIASMIDLTDYAKKSEIPTKTSQLIDDVGYATGGVEITSGNPAKSSTVLTLNPNAEEISIYTAEESDDRYQPKGDYLTQHQSLSGYAKTADHYTKTESDKKYLTAVPNEYITEEKLTAKAETWTFTLENGSTVTKEVVLA